LLKDDDSGAFSPGYALQILALPLAAHRTAVGFPLLSLTLLSESEFAEFTGFSE
jgi:hypothetical protein